MSKPWEELQKKMVPQIVKCPWCDPTCQDCQHCQNTGRTPIPLSELLPFGPGQVRQMLRRIE
jgi:hypothetical protein